MMGQEGGAGGGAAHRADAGDWHDRGSWTGLSSQQSQGQKGLNPQTGSGGMHQRSPPGAGALVPGYRVKAGLVTRGQELWSPQNCCRREPQLRCMRAAGTGAVCPGVGTRERERR